MATLIYLSFLSLVTVFSSLANAQYNQVTGINAAGQPVWTPQPTANPAVVSVVASVPPAAQPTLVWNCQQMQSICTNAYNWLWAHGFRGVIPTPYEMVFDTTGNHKDNRQSRMCGTNVWASHQCPDTSLTVMNDLLPPLPAGVVDPYYYANIGQTTPNGNLWIIPGQTGGQSPSGLKYTCDEFPCASWLQGGTGENNENRGTVMCAASGLRCIGAAYPAIRAAFSNGNNYGEQDWQGQANNFLGIKIRQLYGANAGLGAFQFTTTTMAAPAAGEATTRAYIVMPNDPDQVVFNKRDSPPANPTASVFTEYFASSQHIVIGKPAQTPAPTPKATKLPVMTTVTAASGVSTIVAAGGPTAPPNQTLAQRSVNLEARFNGMSSSGPKLASKKPSPIRFAKRAPLYSNVTQSQIAQAEAIVKAAIEEQSQYNAELFKNPRRNVMNFNSTESLRRRATSLPNIKVNATVAAAAALLAELEAAGKATNLTQVLNSTTSSRTKRNVKRDASFWLDEIDHDGLMAFNPNVSDYTVWRNVVTYGADPTGAQDSTEAINNAISDGYRCGAGCNSSSINGAIVYFPGGTYLVSGSIISMFNTQLVGNPNDWPTILAASSFVGLGVISSDVYIDGGNGAEWYINQNNFFRQIRNFVIDIRAATVAYPAGLHWQVAQATSLQNIEFIQNTGTQQGIFAENGSGGFMSDLTFTGGNFGLYGGNQQYTVRNLTFTGCTTAIGLIWDWGWTWKDLTINSCGTGINMIGAGNTRQTGSVYILDSTFSDTSVALLSTTPLSGPEQGTTYITLDNVVLQNTATAIQDQNGNTVLAGGSTTFNSWTLGNVYNSQNPNGTYTGGENISPIRPLTSELRGNPNGGYFTRSKPQYGSYGSGSIVNVKTFAGAQGDGVSDDTQSIQAAFDNYKGQDVIIWFPAGTYIVTDTIIIPEGSKVVGEVWSQIMASGSNFEDMGNPHVMVQVGNPGDVGSVEIQDMLFTTKGATAGAVLVEWNILQSSSGTAAMWDSHFRIGGALGNDLQLAQCPTKSTTDYNTDCIAASMLLHITSTASAYLENVWAWTADHDIDDPLNTMIDVYSARGILIESTGPTWLYGTACEHNVLYQYELYQAENVFMGMIQTESPYYPPDPAAPAPFANGLGAFNADPDFSNCAADSTNCAVSWALRMVASSNIQIAGAGLYSWFQDHDEACVDTQNCQQSLVSTYLSDDIWLYNLITIGSVEMVSPYGSTYSAALANANTDSTGHPYWSIISAWLLLADGASSDLTPTPGQTITMPSWFWAVPTPSVSCWFPCVIDFPPLTVPPLRAPVITSVIDGSTQTITPPAIQNPTITVSPITITASPTAPLALTSISTAVTFSQSAISYPPFEYTDPNNNEQINITGIYIPLPVQYPPNNIYGGKGGVSSSGCWFLCNWPVSIGPFNIINSPPWPLIDTPPPPGTELTDDGDDDDGEDDDSDNTDNDQPQESNSESSSSTTSSSSSSSSSSSESCSVTATMAIATGGVSFASPGSAWASSYPTASVDPVFGGPVSMGVSYTPLTTSTILLNTGAAPTSTTTSTTSTSSTVVSPPTNTAGGSPRYDIFSTSEESDNEWIFEYEGYGSYTSSTYDECDFHPDWETEADDTDMPATLDGITVFGDTCNYSQTSSWSAASSGSTVGILTCDKWSQATCWKGSVSSDCVGVEVVDLVYCEW